MVSREVLTACRRGDSQAFEELVRNTYRHVYTQAFRLVQDRQDAEDVAQEAYLRVFRGLSGFRGDAQFETWLYRIVANTALTHLRRRKRFGELALEPDLEQAAAPSEVPLSDRTVDRDAISKALEGLSPSLRAVVVLKEIYGLSCRDIGRELGVSEGAVKVRLHRARQRLKQALFEGGGRDEV